MSVLTDEEIQQIGATREIRRLCGSRGAKDD